MSIKEILMYAWQLPQNLLGLAVRAYCRKGKKGEDWYGATFSIPRAYYAPAALKGGNWLLVLVVNYVVGSVLAVIARTLLF